MEAKDGSFGLDFEGIYSKVNHHEEISYTMADGRTATTLFSEEYGKTNKTTSFDPATENDSEIQKQGWQTVLDNFVKYVE